MNRENFNRAAHLYDYEAKLKKLKQDLIRDQPQFEYDPDYKEIGREIFNIIDKKLDGINKELEEL
jgi:hypothetical protein